MGLAGRGRSSPPRMLEFALQTLISDYPAVAAAALVAGLVRGFAGFGTAMIYLPVAAQVSPFFALTTLIVIDLVAPLIHVPRALRDGHPGDVLRLALGAAITLPLGVWLLTVVSADVFRWGVSLVALTLLGLLWAGVRYRGTPTKPMVFGTGALGGVLTGSVGMPGPPVILLYMASTLPSAVVRANNMLYLILADLLLLGAIWWVGYLEVSALSTGAVLILPYLIGNWIGGRLYRPEAETAYRTVAYLIIAASALYGLPIWD